MEWTPAHFKVGEALRSAVLIEAWASQLGESEESYREEMRAHITQLAQLLLLI